MRTTGSVLGTLMLLLACLTTPIAFADVIAGRVVGVVDGDTIDVLSADKVQFRIRVSGIDAPEKRQPFGTAAKKHLSDLVFAQSVVVDWHKMDRYKRILGKVSVQGQDAGLAMVRDGFAWHFKKYQMEQAVGDRVLYAAAEVEARRGSRGLWANSHPVAPWEFRNK